MTGNDHSSRAAVLGLVSGIVTLLAAVLGITVNIGFRSGFLIVLASTVALFITVIANFYVVRRSRNGEEDNKDV